MLPLVFPPPVLVRGVTDFVRLEKDYLGHTLIRVKLRGKRRGMGKLQRNEAFPLRLEGGNVDDNAAAGISGFSEANGQHISRDAKVFNGPRKRKGIRRNKTDVA